MPQPYGPAGPTHYAPPRESWGPGRYYDPYAPIPNASGRNWANPPARPMPQPPLGSRSREDWERYQADLARWHEENPYGLQ